MEFIIKSKSKKNPYIFRGTHHSDRSLDRPLLNLRIEKNSIEISRNHPLWYGNIVKGKVYGKTKKALQELTLDVAFMWNSIAKWKSSNHLREYEFYLMSLRKYCSRNDHTRKIFEFFFNIVEEGYRFSNSNKSAPSIVSPKTLNGFNDIIESMLKGITWVPPAVPNFNKHRRPRISVLEIQDDIDIDKLKTVLIQNNQTHLIPQIDWLISQKNITFYFLPCGELQERETSVWPIKNIENWPSAIRQILFGNQIDIDCSLHQFIWLEICKDDISKHGKVLETTKLKYKDIMDLVANAKDWREALLKACNIAVDDNSIAFIKRVIISISNNSNITPKMIRMCSRWKSAASRLVWDKVQEIKHDKHITLKEENDIIEIIGTLLHDLVVQFRMARYQIMKAHGIKPGRKNNKWLFHQYFKWEAMMRDKLWHLFGKTGLMLHDGIDGVSKHKIREILNNNTDISSYIVEQLGLKVSYDECPVPEDLKKKDLVVKKPLDPRCYIRFD